MDDDLNDLVEVMPLIEMFERREQQVFDRSLRTLDGSLSHVNHLTVTVVAIMGVVIPLATSQAFQPARVRVALLWFSVALCALVLEQLGSRWVFGWGLQRFEQAHNKLATAVGHSIGANDGSVGDVIAALGTADQAQVTAARKNVRIAGAAIHLLFLAAFMVGTYYLVTAGFYSEG